MHLDISVDDLARALLLRQFDTAWRLAQLHLETLSTEECLWRPASLGLHVRETLAGWRGEWPEHERYDLGPPSIAWLTWHIGLWWSMVLNHSFGAGDLTPEQVTWPGTADGVRNWLAGLAEEWRTIVEAMTADELRSMDRTRWPFAARPFGDVVAWVNTELAKNAAEIGYARFLYAARRTCY
jgi:hypothetical protein